MPIQNKKAKEIATLILKYVSEKKRDDEFKAMRNFISLEEDVAIPNFIFRLIDELNLLNSSHKNPIRFPYDDCIAFRNYLEQFLPTEITLDIVSNYPIGFIRGYIKK